MITACSERFPEGNCQTVVSKRGKEKDENIR